MSNELNPGDWVRLYGQVVESMNHPDDVTIELFSHNAQFDVDVRKDRVIKVDPSEVRHAVKCYSVFQFPGERGLRLCKEYERHLDDHTDGFISWTSAKEYGRVER